MSSTLTALGGVLGPHLATPETRADLAAVADHALQVATDALAVVPCSAFCVRGAASLLPDPEQLQRAGEGLPGTDRLAERLRQAVEALVLLAQALEYTNRYQAVLCRAAPQSGELPEQWAAVRREARREACSAVGRARAALHSWRKVAANG